MTTLIDKIKIELNKVKSRENDNLYKIQEMTTENRILCKTRHQLEDILDLAKKEEDNSKEKQA
ncbi:MAG: hypothetical protein GY804_01195 [Alphaproteobacteria bacterium]|nr:hypothetical protein [Alphaproteobacteria bacterium]